MDFFVTKDGVVLLNEINSIPGSMANYSNSSRAPWEVHNSNITTVVIQSGVTSIGDYAFYSCYNLTDISIPKSVRSIGEYSFSDSNIILTSALKVMDVNVTRQLEAIYDGTFTGQDAMLGADTDSTGFIAVEGHQQLSDDALAKLADCYKLLKAGEIVPASQWTEFGPTDFPGLN